MKLMRLACQTSMGLLVLATAYVVATHRQSYTFLYSFDSSISLHAQQDVIAWATQQQKNSQNPTILISDLCNYYAWIADCSLVYLPNARLKISIAAHVPTFKVQNDLVALDTGILVAQNIFESSYLASLATITLHESLMHDADVLQRLQKWLAQAGAVVCDRCTIECFSTSQVKLHDKDSPFTIILSLSNEQGNQSSFLYYPIIKEIGLKKLKMVRNKKRMIADMRFKNYIIFYGDKGEYHEQTYT